jgi:hypothetical protein
VDKRLVGALPLILLAMYLDLEEPIQTYQNKKTVKDKSYTNRDETLSESGSILETSTDEIEGEF